MIAGRVLGARNVIPDESEQYGERLDAAGLEHEQVPAPEVAPLIAAGLYDVRTLRLERRRLWGAWKTMIECELVGGEHDGVRLLWCATSLPRGRRRVPISSKIFRTIVMALGRRPERGERISETLLVHKLFRARVRTVTAGADGRPLPPATHYSIIDSFVERIA